jgi:hypothetical protein
LPMRRCALLPLSTNGKPFVVSLQCLPPQALTMCFPSSAQNTRLKACSSKDRDSSP